MIENAEIGIARYTALMVAVLAVIHGFATTEGSAHETLCLSETKILSSLATDLTEKQNRLSQFMAEFEPLEQQRNSLSQSEFQAWDQKQNWQRLRQNINATTNVIEGLYSSILTQSARVSVSCD